MSIQIYIQIYIFTYEFIMRTWKRMGSEVIDIPIQRRIHPNSAYGHNGRGHRKGLPWSQEGVIKIKSDPLKLFKQ